MKRNPLDPRTQTDGESDDAKHSAATDAKVPPSFMDSKVGVEDQEVAKHVDQDVEESTRNEKDPVP